MLLCCYLYVCNCSEQLCMFLHLQLSTFSSFFTFSLTPNITTKDWPNCSNLTINQIACKSFCSYTFTYSKTRCYVHSWNWIVCKGSMVPAPQGACGLSVWVTCSKTGSVGSVVERYLKIREASLAAVTFKLSFEAWRVGPEKVNSIKGIVPMHLRNWKCSLWSDPDFKRGKWSLYECLALFIGLSMRLRPNFKYHVSFV